MLFWKTIRTKKDKVIKPVIKPESYGDLNERPSALESGINEIKSFLLLNESANFQESKNRWARGDSNARPSPCKGDVIAG